MGHLMIKFAKPQDVAELATRLSDVENFSIRGDWHEYRISGAIEAAEQGERQGFPVSNPNILIQSIEDARQKHGVALWVQLRLNVIGIILDGSLYDTGILLSNLSVDASEIRDDLHVHEFCTALSQTVGDIDVSFG